MVNLELIEKLKEYIPMYLWERINHPAGYVVNNEEFNARWNLSATQGDYHADTLTAMVELLLSILEGAGIDPMATINDVQFYSDGYQVTYTDGVVKQWKYETDGWGFITRLVNQTDQRPITLGWHEEPIGG
jgi:hypothetical protein